LLIVPVDVEDGLLAFYLLDAVAVPVIGKASASLRLLEYSNDLLLGVFPGFHESSWCLHYIGKTLSHDVAVFGGKVKLYAATTT